MPDDSAVAVAPAPDQHDVHFELLEQLSRGSVGRVHKARQPKFRRIIALRIVEVPEWLDDPKALVERILTEARAASQLSHPHIAKIVGGAHKQLKVFLVSELIEGQTLQQVLSQQTFTALETIAFAKQLLAGLDCAATSGVFHHALNPANIKLLPQGSIKILDYGVIQDRYILSQTPVKKLENQHYLSPEQVKGRPLDKTSNLFSAGTILYEMFTGRTPFAGKHLAEVERNISDVDAYPLSRVRQSVPDEISKVILKALAKNPRERFQSGQELITALTLCESKATQARTIVPQPAVVKTAAPLPTKTMAAAAPAKPVATPAAAKAAPPVAVAKGTKTLPSIAQLALSLSIPGVVEKHWKPITGISLVVLFIGLLSILWRHPQTSKPLANPALVETTESITPPAAPPPVEESTPSVSDPAAESRTKVAKLKKARLAPVVVPTAAVILTGELAVSSLPSGARIELDGQAGATWVTTHVIAAVAPGHHIVKLSKAGYATEVRSIEVSSGNRAMLEVRLTPTKGLVNIAGTPAGSSILVNGKDMGKLSPAEIMLDPGPQTITLHKEGYLDASTNVTLRAGENFAFSPALRVAGKTDSIKVAGGGIKKIFGGGGASVGMVRIQVKSRPKGADITINGTQLQKHTPADLDLEPGNYAITLQLAGYQPLQKVVTVEAGTQLKVDEELIKQ